jgi:hypothetical protein
VGGNTGTYVVGRLGQHWADFDKPTIPDEADTARISEGCRSLQRSPISLKKYGPHLAGNRKAAIRRKGKTNSGPGSLSLLEILSHPPSQQRAFSFLFWFQNRNLLVRPELFA